MTKAAFARDTLASPTEAQLNFYRRGPGRKKARGVVQINHGLAEHAARYARFAEFLAGHGFHTYVHDHRGHGATTAPDTPARVFARENGADAVIADVDAVHDHIAERHPGLPVICFGHSMGGLVALNFALANSGRIAGLACWNANFSAGLAGHAAVAILAWERFRLGSDVPSRVLPRLTFDAWAKQVPDAETDFDWLSHDAEEVAKYVADPLCGWPASVSMWRDVLEFVFRGADDRKLAAMRRDLPISLVGGGSDPSTEGGKATRALETRLKAVGFADVACTVYPDCRHESLNEINRDAVMADFVQWANRIVAGKAG